MTILDDHVEALLFEQFLGQAGLTDLRCGPSAALALATGQIKSGPLSGFLSTKQFRGRTVICQEGMHPASGGPLIAGAASISGSSLSARRLGRGLIE